MKDCNVSQFKRYSEVEECSVEWCWYPYIPFGKITILQGDPGYGKSTLMMDIIASLSTGRKLPDGTGRRPMNIIYQCSEDGAADTIKPRLVAAGADCRRVAFLDEDLADLTLDDEKIRQAIEAFKAKLLVIDPFQAYLNDSDMFNASKVRKVLRRLGMWASTYGCAVVLIGHLNKKQGSKELYRGLGSIDLIASARSVLQLDRSEEVPEVRVIHHIKSSLAPRGEDVFYTIEPPCKLRWVSGQTMQNIQAGSSETDIPTAAIKPSTKQEQTAEMLKNLLSDGPVAASEVNEFFTEQGVSVRTVQIVKGIIGVKSVKREGQWFWELPTAEQ